MSLKLSTGFDTLVEKCGFSDSDGQNGFRFGLTSFRLKSIPLLLLRYGVIVSESISGFGPDVSSDVLRFPAPLLFERIS